MSTPCGHPRTGIVTTHPNGGYENGSHAATDVCDQPACIAEQIAWAQRYTGRPAFHVPDAQKAEVSA